jgi:GWxTD domain-containing protein
MRRLLVAIAIACLAAPVASAASLGELFQKAKAEFSAGKYDQALKTLDELKAESGRPENEKVRPQLAPPLAFYRGASLAALGRSEEARAEFETFLGFQPNATLDSAAYPKKVIAAFDAARRSREKSGAGDSGIAAAYRDFHAGTVDRPADDNWASGPVRFLMTASEKTSFSGIVDPAERARFVEEFWRSRDPKPETPENEFRTEFERRVAFADANFAQGEKKGSDTDRGMVFVLLGPPTYVGRKPLGTGDDASDASGLSTGSRHDAEIAIRAASATGKTSTSTNAQIADRSRGPGTSVRDAANNWREVWHYRRELLPAGVPYQQVDFEFVTKQGYGENVLQRDSSTLATIEAARRANPARS